MLITVATNIDGYYPALYKKCQQLNVSMTTLGIGEEWSGLTDKLLWSYNYIKNLPETTIVTFVDAYDVLILEDEAEIEKRFKSFNADIVFAVQHEKTNRMSYIMDKVYGTCLGEHLNSGTYTGYAGSIKLFLEYLVNNYNIHLIKEDQVIVSDTVHNADGSIFIGDKKIKLSLDKHGELFLVLTDAYTVLPNFKINLQNHSDIKIDNNQFINKSTREQPCFIHGPNKLNMDALTKYQSLPSAVSYGNLSFYFKRMKQYIKYLRILDILKLPFICGTKLKD